MSNRDQAIAFRKQIDPETGTYYTYRKIASMLDISPQRVEQLVSGQEAAARRRIAKRRYALIQKLKIELDADPSFGERILKVVHSHGI